MAGGREEAAGGDKRTRDTLALPVRRELRAMNSDIELVCYAADAEHRLDRAAVWLQAYEARYSRFGFLSELSRLNRASGRPYSVSRGLCRLVELALELARRSDGVFDPTILRSLEAAGYDRSFELIEKRPELRAPRPQRATARQRWREVVLDPEARTVTLPEGTGIDLGGIGKGFAVDRLASMLQSPCLVNGGGDVYLAGQPHDAHAWLVGIENPFAPDEDLRLLSVRDRAVATSTTLRRRWPSADPASHHLIDTRTGAPSQTDAVQVTVVAPSALLADYHAKVTLLKGVHVGLRYVDCEDGIECLIVDRDGGPHESAGLRRFIVSD